MADWYVLASLQRGSVLEIRLVAGPLTKDAAMEEASKRIRRGGPDDIKFSLVEFDPLYGMMPA